MARGVAVGGQTPHDSSVKAVIGFVVLAASVAGCDREAAQPEPARRKPDRTAPTAAPGTDTFGVYVLALSWAPSFCCGHPDKEECTNLPTAFAGTHLTLHGLWPNYTDAEVRGSTTYPQFCGAFQHCKRDNDASCAPDPSTIPDEMRVLGPGYVGDHDFLAVHEWPKHGSCTGLDPAGFFRAALAAMKALPGEGTPDAIGAAVGGDLALTELETAFGVPKESVLLGCDPKCRLSQVSFCLAHDATNHPTTPVACPRNTTLAQYDNGCVTRGCQRVAIPEAGSCDVSGAKPKAHQKERSQNGNGATRACDHPGQGPACRGNDECVKGGFTRCARSGCCTSQP